MKEKIIAILLFLIPSVDFLPFWNPAVTGRFILFGGFIAAAVPFLVFYYLFSAERFRVTIPDILLLVLFAYISTERIFSGADRVFSIRYYELWGLCILYMVVRSAADEKRIRFLVWAAIAGGSLQLIVGYLQLAGLLRSDNSLFRVTGSFFNSGPYAGYLASVFAISLSCWKAKSFSKARGFCSRAGEFVLLFNLAGVFLMIPLLKSRDCFLAVMVSSVFLYRNEVRLFGKRLAKRGPSGKAIRVLFVSFIVCLLSGGFYLLVKTKASSSQGRYLVWRNTLKMIGDHPLTGVGYDRFKTRYMDYQASYFSTHPGDPAGLLAGNVYYAFCEPLQFVAENGILGLLPVLAGLYFLGRSFWGSTKPAGIGEMTAAAAAGLIAILVFSLFSYTADILPIKMNGIFLLAILVSEYRGRYDRICSFAKWRRSPVFRPVGTFLLLLVIAGFFQASLFLKRLAYGFSDWQNASVLYLGNQFSESRRVYASLYPLFGNDGDFLVHYGKVLYFGGDYGSAIVILRSAKRYIDNTVLETSLGDCYRGIGEYTLAEDAYLTASYMMPGSFYNKYLLVKLYQDGKEVIKARRMADEIQHLTIKVPSPAIDSIKSEMKEYLSAPGF